MNAVLAGTMQRQQALPPPRAIERLRVEAARRLLSESGLPVKRISQRCGFGFRGNDATKLPTGCWQSPHKSIARGSARDGYRRSGGIALIGAGERLM